MSAVIERPVQDRAMEVLRRSGNPFRNYFARNPDDEVCSRYHVPELYAREREMLLAAVDLYRYDALKHSEVIPILGNKGSGKTHLLHSIKYGQGQGWQLLVTPGTYQKGSDFAEYILFQMIDTLLGGGKQRGGRPLNFVGEELTRRLLRNTLQTLDTQQKLDLFPAPALARWARRLGLGVSQADERTQWLIDTMGSPEPICVRKACAEVNLDANKAADLVNQYIDRTEIHNTAGQMRRKIYQGFVRATLLGDEADLAQFLTHGFVESDSPIRPSRQDLVLALMKTLMDVFLALKMPVVVAFDQLEDLLLVRRNEDGHKVSESFFAGIVQLMHQVDGLLFLVFAERGLWNRFVPSLDGYIQDRLNNPVHLPDYGTINSLKLEAPPAHLVWQVVAARLRPGLEDQGDLADISPIYPFSDEQITRIARTEPTLRDMLQQFRHLFDHLIYGNTGTGTMDEMESLEPKMNVEIPAIEVGYEDVAPPRVVPTEVKSVTIVQAPAETPKFMPEPIVPISRPVCEPVRQAKVNEDNLKELWERELHSARTKLEPEGALTGATRELQAGLGAFLMMCHEHGVKVGSWRMQHAVPDFTFGDHPTYGAMSIAHWSWKGQTWRVGIGLFLGRGPGKPKDLQIKLGVFDTQPPVIDHLIMLRPADDTVLSGKSKTMWDLANQKGNHARLEPVRIDEYAMLYAFPRWIAALHEALPEGQPLPNLAEFLQDHCERLLEQVCMPSQG